MKKVIIFALILPSLSLAMTIDDYMKEVVQKNKNFTSYELATEAAAEKQTAGDLSLAPVLTAAYSINSDKSLPTTVADRRDLTTTSLGLAKKFSTGTSLSLTADTFKNEYFQPVTAGNTGYSTGRLGLTLQQSLWKDSFGRATRMRQSRDVLVAKLETLSNDLKRRAAIIQAESDYWDFIVAVEDVKLKKANLDRAKKLEQWTSNRVFNGIGEQTDLLQIKALVSRRELELNNSLDEQETNAVKIRENLGLTAGEPLPQFSSKLTDSRPYVTGLLQQKNVIKMESYLSSLEAEIKKQVAEETEDSMRPDLSLTGKYYTSSYDVDYGTMQSNITKTDRPVTYVGINLSWMFGADAVSSLKESAKKDALASKNRAEQSRISGMNAWEDHLRKYELTKQNVSTLEKIMKLQTDRSKQEQIRFSKGRTITTNVVNAETDSAEAEVSYLRAKSGLRKMEAAMLLYLSLNE